MKPINIPSLLREYQLKAKKSLGQNFLTSDFWLEKIVLQSGVTKNNHVLEIGAGIGNLTRWLAEYGSEVTTVEIDKNLIPILKDIIGDYQNIDVLHEDILNLDPIELVRENTIVVANIPYYITSAIIKHLLTANIRPQKIYLTIQEEVARRICAKPGNLSVLAISVQIFGQPEIKMKIPANAFYPPPKVDSALLEIDIFDEPLINPDYLDSFFKIVKAGFAQKRKTLRNSLSAGLHLSTNEIENVLEQCSIDSKRRAQTLSLQEWQQITKLLAS